MGNYALPLGGDFIEAKGFALDFGSSFNAYD
jgi:hypothetical protein